MNNTDNWFTKKKVIYIGLIGLLFFLFSYFSKDLGICSNYASKCSDISYLFVIFSFIFIPVFIFSILIYKLKDSVFLSWKNFSIWVIPIFLIAISFLPTDTHGLDFVPITKGTVIFVLTILYSVISFILILYKSLKKE